MVKALRYDSIKIQEDSTEEGLYVVGRSNALTLDIPKLPSLSIDSLKSIVVKEKLSHDDIESSSDVIHDLNEGDIIWLDPKFHRIRSILSSKANSNTLLVTERCENRCIFCSQPPNDLLDARLYTNALLSILNFDSSEYIGISGGEPTYNRTAFLSMLTTLRDLGNSTPLHILSNGRNFSDKKFSYNVSKALSDRKVLWGIPIYGHRSSMHDELVKSTGALNETLQGLLHLGESGSNIEIRVVPTQYNIRDLPDIISFLVTSLPFISCLSIMNLEPKGWARKNFNELEISVSEQNKYLIEAISIAENYSLDIRLFNYPLCLLDKSIHGFTSKSISDWKNYYPIECTECTLKSKCGGFFTSAQGKFIEKIEAVI